MTRAILSLGSNLGDRLAHLRAAVELLGETVVLVSGVYETPPWGDTGQPAYLNGVVLVDDPGATLDEGTVGTGTGYNVTVVFNNGTPATFDGVATPPALAIGSWTSGAADSIIDMGMGTAGVADGVTQYSSTYSVGFISPATYAFDQVDVKVLLIVAFGGLGTLLGPVVGAGVFAILDEQLTTSLELREVLYGVFVIVIFLFFRRGVVNTVVALWDRLRARRRAQLAVQRSRD